MKKYLSGFIILVMIVLYPSAAFAAEGISAKASVLIDYKSGMVLYQNNKDMVLPEASITKLMTYYVIKDYIKNNNINTDTKVIIDKASIALQDGASGLGLKAGDQIALKDLISSMLILSANDSAMALKAFYEKSGNSFIAAMNQKASALGLKNTHFINPTGLTDSDSTPALNTTSAYDIAVLAKKLIDNYPEILSTTSCKTFEYNGKSFRNTNGVIYKNNRVDGLKTGHTKEAGYCLAATEKINGSMIPKSSFTDQIIIADMRLISIVFGCSSEEQRISDSITLLDYGEKNFAYELCASPDKKYKCTNELYGNGYIEVYPAETKYILKNKSEKLSTKITINEELPHKIKKGDIVGKLYITDKNNITVYSCSVKASDDYKMVGILKRIQLLFNKMILYIRTKLF